MGRSEVSTSVVKWNEVWWGGVKVLVTGCLTLLEDIQAIWSLIASFIFFWFYCVYTVVCLVWFCLIFYIMYYYCYVYIFLLLCVFRSMYCVSLCCSVYCLCVTVYCTASTACQPNCSYQIQSGPKKCIHSLFINIFGINLNEISISGWECNIMFSQQMAQALL